MKTLTILGALCASAAFATVPVIDTSTVSVRQDNGKTVIIEYTLGPASAGDAEPAIITVDILTNAVGEAAASVGGEHLKTLSGDVNRIIAQGRHKILWFPAKEGLPEVRIPAAQVTARITAWPTNSPPTYWIIDLSSTANAKDRMCDRYYTDAAQIPGTVTNNIYKTDRLVLRRIPAKGVTWRQGSSESYGLYTYRYVSFSYDYYIAVYEFTKAQHNKISPTWNPQDENGIPVSWAFSHWRGNPVGASAYNWPSNGHESVSAGCLIDKLRTLVGGIPFDMPTDAEWEYACRAGSSTKYCNGDTEADLAKVAWYSANADGVLHEVGLREPNAWGIYDMHGNCAEYCLDKCSKRTSDPVWDPTGPMQDDIVLPTDNVNRFTTVRGGGRWGAYASWSADKCTSTYVQPLGYGEESSTVRMTLPLQ